MVLIDRKLNQFENLSKVSQNVCGIMYQTLQTPTVNTWICLSSYYCFALSGFSPAKIAEEKALSE